MCKGFKFFCGIERINNPKKKNVFGSGGFIGRRTITNDSRKWNQLSEKRVTTSGWNDKIETGRVYQRTEE